MDISGDALPHPVHDMIQRGEVTSSSGEKPGDGKDGKDGPVYEPMDDQPVARLTIKNHKGCFLLCINIPHTYIYIKTHV